MQANVRAVGWVRDGAVGMEFAEFTLGANRLTAVGVAIGAEPEPYRLDYRIVTGAGFITSHVRCVCRGEGWRRTLDLHRSRAGTWSIAGGATGVLDMPPPGGDPDALAGATDGDLAFSPVTNTLPLLRERMIEIGRSVDLITAWISVPDLRVAPDEQRYTVVRCDHEGTVARYEAGDGSFAAEVSFDRDGIVVDYPRIARRLDPGARHL